MIWEFILRMVHSGFETGRALKRAIKRYRERSRRWHEITRQP